MEDYLRVDSHLIRRLVSFLGDEGLAIPMATHSLESALGYTWEGLDQLHNEQIKDALLLLRSFLDPKKSDEHRHDQLDRFFRDVCDKLTENHLLGIESLFAHVETDFENYKKEVSRVRDKHDCYFKDAEDEKQIMAQIWILARDWAELEYDPSGPGSEIDWGICRDTTKRRVEIVEKLAALRKDVLKFVHLARWYQEWYG